MNMPLEAGRIGGHARVGDASRTALGILLIVLGAIVFRVCLDQSGSYVTRVYLDRFYSGIVEQVFNDRAWWYVLLPIPEFKGTWSTTGFVLLYLLETTLGPHATFLLATSAATAAFGWCAWTCSRSPVFALIAAGALAFSPFNYSVYLWNGSNNAYTLILFLSMAIGAQCRVAFHGGGLHWRIASVVALVLAAVCYEIWLNYVIALFCAAPLYFAYARKHGLPIDARARARARFVLLSTAAVAVIYLIIRARFLHKLLIPGLEAQAILQYPSVGPMIDDTVYNVFFYFYLTIVQILPGALGGSVAIYADGRLPIATLTGGYQPDLDFLVRTHFIYLWQFYAGATFTLSCCFVYIAGRKTLEAGSGAWLITFALALGIVLGSPTHSVLKFVGFNAVPLYSYKVAVSLMALYLLCAHGVRLACERLRGPARRRLLLGIAALYLGFIAVDRPHWANENIAEIWGEVGFFANGFYPEPWKNLKSLLRAAH